MEKYMTGKCMVVPRNANGFTLVELLTVIVIIGVLAALLLTALGKAKSEGKGTSCKNHLKQMGVALQMYVEEHNNRYPYYIGPAGPSYGDAVAVGGRVEGLVYWSTKLFPYYGLNWTNPLFQCPGYTGSVSGPDHSPYLLGRAGSYGYNIGGSRAFDPNPPMKMYGLGPCVFWTTEQGSTGAVSEGQLTAPSEMLAIGDSAWALRTTPEAARNGQSIGAEPGGDDALGCNINASIFVYDSRHGGNYNQLYCDGHVSQMNPQILFDASNTAVLWN
jgi:prepilin-type N-terminal cleavage/methylation domain-containing protein/prepilin-type processing-associated H-X9-DG protein